MTICPVGVYPQRKMNLHTLQIPFPFWKYCRYGLRHIMHKGATGTAGDGGGYPGAGEPARRGDPQLVQKLEVSALTTWHRGQFTVPRL